MKTLFKYLFRKKKHPLITVGSNVVFKGLNEPIKGVVEKVIDDKARVRSSYLNSTFTQWIDLVRLKRIDD